MTFPMPTIKPGRRGQPPKGITIIDSEGKIYKLNSVRRFSEMLDIPRESFYALSARKMKSLYGMKMYDESLEGLVEGVDYFTVNEEE